MQMKNFYFSLRKYKVEMKQEDKNNQGKKVKKAKEPKYYKSATGMQMLNYKVYYMSVPERLLYLLLAFAAGTFVGYLFYGGIGVDEFGEPTKLTYICNTVVMSLAGLLVAKVFLPIRTEQLRAARQNKLKSQFRDMLEAVTTSLGAGKNVQESFSAAYDDLKNQYEQGAYILNELAAINTGLVNGINVERLLADFGARSGCEDIEDFANVFEICFRKGGNIKETVRITYEILSDKMAVAEEIETIVSGSKSQQSLMLFMPIILVALIKMSSDEFAANFVTPSGLLATTAGVGIFAASYFVGRKILDIKL